MARSFDAGRYNLAGPVVLGFVLTVCVLEQVFPAQRRPLLARGHLLDFCYAVFYALLVIPLVVLLGSGFSDLLAWLAPWLVLLISRHLLVVLGAAALMAGTIVGFVLARTVGIFGFHLTFSSGLAWTVLIVEGAGVVMLLLTAAFLWRRR